MLLLDKTLITIHKTFWSTRHLVLLAQGILFLLVALYIQHIAYRYIDHYVQVGYVGDLFLDYLPVVNLDFFIVQSTLLTTVIIAFFLLLHPNYLPFSVKALALFIIIRSFFISLTHIGAELQQLELDYSNIGFIIYDFVYNSKNDFFFSGYVGLPALFTFIFWRERFLRYLFMGIMITFAIAMILAHMHYSIDIFAAPFIAYGIFTLAKRVFKEDFYLLSQRGVL